MAWTRARQSAWRGAGGSQGTQRAVCGSRWKRACAGLGLREERVGRRNLDGERSSSMEKTCAELGSINVHVEVVRNVVLDPLDEEAGAVRNVNRHVGAHDVEPPDGSNAVTDDDGRSLFQGHSAVDAAEFHGAIVSGNCDIVAGTEGGVTVASVDATSIRIRDVDTNLSWLGVLGRIARNRRHASEVDAVRTRDVSGDGGAAPCLNRAQGLDVASDCVVPTKRDRCGFESSPDVQLVPRSHITEAIEVTVNHGVEAERAASADVDVIVQVETIPDDEITTDPEVTTFVEVDVLPKSRVALDVEVLPSRALEAVRDNGRSRHGELPNHLAILSVVEVASDVEVRVEVRIVAELHAVLADIEACADLATGHGREREESGSRSKEAMGLFVADARLSVSCGDDEVVLCPGIPVRVDRVAEDTG
eukprot:CAMPEP_0197393568 /NCGR_PEP_ID=MMETSP1165-20131217/4395_1 /TAXON_ID=284809 /ORGANISM="Chrysocystis fragilis, Strain CCMP3189" /LENGTH=419 /DNA_ID=CAMNT_0042919241 /DNA_START=422 /DNA_END=1678 /DNA_ORIENTATION=+